VTVIRPFNTYGPRQSARAVIPTIISQIAAGAQEIRLGATHQTRDFTFVSDTAAAFEALAACDSAVGQTVNTGSEFEISIGDTAQAIIELMGREVAIVTEEQRLRPEASEVERLWADSGLMRSLTGWTPEYGGGDGFRRGLRETIDWFSDPANLGRYKTDRYML
jgi:nucleoside-diphosphate-sugar epimerase